MKLIVEVNDGRAKLDILNYTNVVLIPKKNITERVTDYRPISLLNRAFKIISKI